MPHADDLAELRDLQTRAYGRGGGLSDVEAARLRELQTRDGVRPVETIAPAPAQVASPSAASAASAAQSAVRVADPASEPNSDTPSADQAESRRSLLAGRGRLLSVAAAAALVCGVGLGWLLFGQSRAEAVALTSEQQEWQRDLLAQGVYDPGSVRAAAVEEGVVVWTATRDERERTCLILSDGETTSPTCQLTEAIADTGMSGSIVVDAVDASQRQVSVQLLLSASGEPAVAVSSYEYSQGNAGMVYANDAETRIAERLVDEGFDPNSLWVVGYDGDVPVWTAMRLGEPGSCLIYDGSTSESPFVCLDPQTMTEQNASLVLDVADPASGGTTRFELASNGPAYLVITREGGARGAGGD